MSSIGQILFLLFVGLAIGLGYNAWPAATAGYAAASAPLPQALDMTSYAAGLTVAMVLARVASVPWASFPTRLQKYLLSQMQFYQFVVMGAACIAVLIYF